MFELGFAVDGFTPAADIVSQAQAAEAGGADTLWVATHLFQRDSIALAASALAVTTELKVALMAISPYAMHPVHAAMSAATLDELYPGRLVLCLGVGAPTDLQSAGIKKPRPLQVLHEAIVVCRSLFSGEEVSFKGDVFRVQNRRLANGNRNIPIVLAASGPKMLELAGAQADGVILSGATSTPFVKHCLGHVGVAEDSGPIRKYGIVYAPLDIGDERRRNMLRRTLGFMLRGEHHARNIECGGAVLDQAALREAFQTEDWGRVEDLISDDILQRHTAFGNKGHARARVEEYHTAGLDQVIINGITDAHEIAYTLEALKPRA